jgi:hypothetical protein
MQQWVQQAVRTSVPAACGRSDTHFWTLALLFLFLRPNVLSSACCGVGAGAQRGPAGLSNMGMGHMRCTSCCSCIRDRARAPYTPSAWRPPWPCQASAFTVAEGASGAGQGEIECLVLRRRRERRDRERKRTRARAAAAAQRARVRAQTHADAVAAGLTRLPMIITQLTALNGGCAAATGPLLPSAAEGTQLKPRQQALT